MTDTLRAELEKLRDDLERLSAASYRAAIAYSARSKHRSIRNGQGDAYEYARARLSALLSAASEEQPS